MKNKTEAPLNQEVTVWYKHSPKSDLKFSKKVSTPESAKAISLFPVSTGINRLDKHQNQPLVAVPRKYGD